MSSNFARPERWYDLAAGLMRGDPGVAQQIVEYERQADNAFQRINYLDFQPVVVQGVTNLTYTSAFFAGYRVGNLVFVSFRATVTNSPGAAGAVVMTVPTVWPIDVMYGTVTGNGPMNGTMMIYDNSVSTLYHGCTMFNSALGVSGWANAQTNFMGSAMPGVSLAANDQVAYSLCYVTSAGTL